MEKRGLGLIPMNKKGMGLRALYPAVLTIVMIGIVLGIGLYVLSSTREAIAVDHSANESFNSSSTGVSLGQVSLTEFEYITTPTTTFKYYNGTLVSSPADYNISIAGVVTISPAVIANYALTNATQMAVTYYYHYDATNSPEAAFTGIITGTDDFADWISIIVVVLAAAVVLGVVLSSFGRKPGV